MKKENIFIKRPGEKKKAQIDQVFFARTCIQLL